MQYKAGVLSVYYQETQGHDNYQPLADIVIPNIRKYCRKHGYVDVVHKIPMIDTQYGFEKFKLIKQEFERRDTDMLLCVDIDTLITNHTIKIENFTNKENDLYLTRDVNGINTGSFIIKNTKWSMLFIDTVIELSKTMPNEQVAVEYLIGRDQNGSLRIKTLGHPSINSYLYDEYAPEWGVIGDKKIERPTHKQGDWQHGDFLVHLPGLPLHKRIDIITKLQEEIIL